MTDYAIARARIGGMKGLLTKMGDAPSHEHKWKNMPKCPFCGHKDCSGVYTKGGAEAFRCHKPGCSSGNVVLNEITYIVAREGLSDAKPEHGPSPAYKRFLELAGCYEEPPLRAESPKPKVPSPKDSREPVADSQKPESDEDEEIIQQCIEIIRSEQSASVSLLQRRLRLGYGRAARIMDELESRGIVGPSKGTEPRDILIEPKKEEPVLPNPVLPIDIPVPSIAPASGGAPPLALEVETEGEGPEDDGAKLPEELVLKAITIIQAANKASVLLLKRELKLGHGKAVRIMDELERRGIVGPAKGTTDRDILAPSNVVPLPLAGGNEKVKQPEKLPVPRGLEALRKFYSLLEFTENHMTAYLPAENSKSKGQSSTGDCSDGASSCAPGAGAVPDELPVPNPIPKEVARRLKFRPVSLFQKRGLTTPTCEALGFRANPMSNETLIQQLQGDFSWEELVESGLWLEADRKRKLGRRPNAQFYGKGQIGRKPEAERRGPDDKWVWGWCQPVLIPYFNETGELIKLRPHKGGAPAGTVAGRERLYVPRNYRYCADSVEQFETAVICEGEFKADAIWQMLGNGFKLQQVEFKGYVHEPVGVGALPGISYVKNLEMRVDLENWLEAIGCRRVIVAFDEEEKPADARNRFDAQIMARFLAADLARKMHLDARVCVLPKEWRRHGKADWDGALAMLLGG